VALEPPSGGVFGLKRYLHMPAPGTELMVNLDLGPAEASLDEALATIGLTRADVRAAESHSFTTVFSARLRALRGSAVSFTPPPAGLEAAQLDADARRALHPAGASTTTE
jgi:hypothetical protein